MTGKQRIQSLRSVRMVFALAFSLFMAVNSWADSYPEYVTEVKVVGGTESEVDKVAATLKKEDGWVRLDKDLNDNAGGDYIYLFYKTASRKDPKGDYITDLFIREGNDVQAFTLNGRTYYRANYAGGDHFKSVHGNLNSGTGTKTADLWLFYSRSNFSDKRAVSSIWVNSSSSGAVSGIDLNKGAGGDDIFMHISTETKVNAPKTDPVFKSGLVYNGKERALIETDASLWSGSMIYSYHEGVIEHYRLNYNAVKATNAGTYTIEYYASATDYAAETSVQTRTVTIGKSKNNGVSVEIESSYLQGSSISPSVSANLSKGSVTYKYSTSQNGEYSSTTPSQPGSYWVKAVVDGDVNCESKTTSPKQFKIIPSIAYMTIATIPAHTYTGSAICPELSIKDGSKTLVQGTDYTVSCSNNVNVGLATMTITGMGSYAGSTTRSFAISPKSVSGFTLTYDDSPIYTGSAICPTVVVTDGETELVQGTDYTVECENNVNVGEKATVGVFGIGNYTGSQYGPIIIKPKSLQNFDVTYDNKVFYRGFAVCPTVVVTDGETELVEGKDYTVECQNNVNVGDEATVGVLGMGNYTGNQYGSFAIEYATYVDEYGKKRNCGNCVKLSSKTGSTVLSGGWYVAEGSVSMADVYFSSDVNIILADGAELKVDAGRLEYGMDVNGSVVIYGQEKQTGSLWVIGASKGIYARSCVAINGGTVRAEGEDYGVYASYNFVINGGKVNASGKDYGICSYGDITLGWTDAENDRITASSYISENGSVKIANGKVLKGEDGNSYAGTLTSDQIAAIAGMTLTPLPNVPYFDENGERQICANYTMLKSSDKRSELPGGWYVATGTVNIAGINFTGNANIILADDANLTVNGGDDYGIRWYKLEPGLISIYGQEKQTGSLSVITDSDFGILFDYGSTVTVNGGMVTATGSSTGIIATNFTVNGGMVNATGNDDGIIATNVTVNGGTVSATGNNEGIYANEVITITGGTVTSTGSSFGIFVVKGDASITGGTVTSTGDDYGLAAYYGNITLSWTDAEKDLIKASSFYSENGSVKIADGMTFKDEDGNTYSGTLNDDQIAAIKGKTLTPYIIPVSYIDENGEKQICEKYTLLQNSEDRITLPGGWYVATGSVNMAGITFTDDANIILADRAYLTVNAGDGEGVLGTSNADIAIYGQEKQTGSISISGELGVAVMEGSFTINGGNVSITGNHTGIDALEGVVTINGGDVSITGQMEGIIANQGSFTINGGNVSVNGDEVGIGAFKGVVTINGGFVSVTGDVFCDNEIVLGWTDPEKDGIVIDNIEGAGTIRIADDKPFKDIYGNTYSGTLDSWLINGKTLIPAPAELPVVFADCDGFCGSVDINGNYSGKFPVDVPDTVEVDQINFNRDFTAGVPATVVLPFELPKGSSVNATFFSLKEVVQVGNAWQATVQTIGSKNLPKANTPYVVLPQSDRLEFDLKGNSAHVFTNKKDTTKVSDDKWLFVGVYTYKDWKEGDGELGLAYAFAGSQNVGGAAEGEFGKIVAGASANPLRAYLRKRDADVQLYNLPQDAQVPKGRPVAPGESPVANYSVELLPESIDVLFIDEDENGEQTTFMARMNTRTGEFKMLRNYDLKGRKLNGAPKARGAYYGKRVLNK